MIPSPHHPRRALSLAVAGVLGASALTLAAPAPSAYAAASTTAYALSGTSLLSFDPAKPAALSTTALVGVTAGETLVGIDVRPQNGMLYSLGVNASTNTATLYAVAPETGSVTPVGTAGAIAMTDGVNSIDLPDPAAFGYGVDFNPAADRLRVVVGGLNFRVNPNSGLPVDGDNTGNTSGSVSGTNPDGPVNGLTTTVDAAAYTNNRANQSSTTLYTLDATSDSLYLQNPPNTGGQTLGVPVTLGGSPLNFTTASGFDIDDSVDVPASNTPVTAGSAYAVLSAAGSTGLYTINLTTGGATLVGQIGNGTLAVQGLALQRNAATAGRPVVGLSVDGQNLQRFASTTPGTVTTQVISGVTAGDKLAALTWRPATGQLFGLGVNATEDKATLYRLDPQTGAATAIGPTGQIAFTTDGSTKVELADPAAVAYGMDVNPTVDRIRVVTGDGRNFRVNPNNGAPVDGNFGSGVVGGTNPDGGVNGLAAGSTGLSGVAYTNSYGQSLTGGATTAYGVDPVANQLIVLNPPNSGTATNRKALTRNGSPLDVAGFASFDIPREVKVTTSNVPAAGTAYASFVAGGVPGLYLLDLATGKATSLGTIGAGATVRSIAVGQAQTPPPPPPPAPKTPATLTKVAGAKQVKTKVDTGRVLKCPATFPTSSCSVAVKITVASGKSKGKVLGKVTTTVGKGKAKRLTVKLSSKGKSFVKAKGKVKTKIAITYPGAAGAKNKTVTVTFTLKKSKF